MNKIRFDIEVIEGDEVEVEDSLPGSLMIEMWIDGQHFRKIFQDNTAVVVFDELVKSMHKSGKYLLFTCSCGVPECHGWSWVNVEKTDQAVKWQFERGEKYYFIFEKGNYVRAINDLKWKIASYKDYVLEPEQYFYPEQ